MEDYTANARFFYHERQQIRSERNRRKRTNEKNEEDKNEDGGLSDELLSEYDELTPKEAHEQGKPGVTSACIFCGGLFSDSPTKRVNPNTKVKTPGGIEYTYWEDETATEPLLHPSCYKTRKAMIDGDEHRTLGAFEGEE